MNPYQKAATIALRLFGGLIAVRGASGPVYIAFDRAISGNWPTYESDRWAASAIWLVGGALLMLLSKPLGRLFGSGLD
jgi:hypothetical protein